MSVSESTVAAWQKIESCEAVCAAVPDVVAKLFGGLDLARPDLAATARAWQGGETVRACEALLAHYREVANLPALRLDPSLSERLIEAPRAADILLDVFRAQGVQGCVPRLADGGLDWGDCGPRSDPAYCSALNRHGMLRPLLSAWAQTGNPAYAAKIDGLLRDWILHNPVPEEHSRSRIWRPIHAGLRITPWIRVFFGLQTAAAFHPATRILMLAAFADHAAYLDAYGGQWLSNIRLMEFSALARIGLAFPEFKRARQWHTRGENALLRELADQVYPDGVQNEQSAHYHHCSMAQILDYMELATMAGTAVAPKMAALYESMANYLAYCLRPNAVIPLNSDSDHDEVSARVRAEAERHSRDDWIYVITNGERGERPADPPSRFFPWAGQMISRSGWERGAQWSFFDCGSRGSGHGHFDKAHLSIHAGGRDLLVDSGRFSYDTGGIGGLYRYPYAFHTAGHNAVLIDGRGQWAEKDEYSSCEQQFGRGRVEDVFDYVSVDVGAFENLEGLAEHRRALLYVRGTCWIVLDRIRSDRPRHIEVLWHFHPTCEVTTAGLDTLTADRGQTNLRVTPFLAAGWKLRLARGQMEPRPQGWYSAQYNSVEPCACAVYEAQIQDEMLFGWVIATAAGEAPKVGVEVLSTDPAPRVRVRIGKDEPFVATVPPDDPGAAGVDL